MTKANTKICSLHFNSFCNLLAFFNGPTMVLQIFWVTPRLNLLDSRECRSHLLAHIKQVHPPKAFKAAVLNPPCFWRGLWPELLHHKTLAQGFFWRVGMWGGLVEDLTTLRGVVWEGLNAKCRPLVQQLTAPSGSVARLELRHIINVIVYVCDVTDVRDVEVLFSRLVVLLADEGALRLVVISNVLVVLEWISLWYRVIICQGICGWRHCVVVTDVRASDKLGVFIDIVKVGRLRRSITVISIATIWRQLVLWHAYLYLFKYKK